MADINASTPGAPTGNILVDTLIWGGSWSPGLGQGASIRWTTATTGTYTPEEGGATRSFTARPWTTAELTALRESLQAFSNVTKLTFVELPQGSSGADMIQTIPDAGGRPIVGFTPESQGAHQTPDGSGPKPLYGYYNDQHFTFTEASLRPGGTFFNVLLHEIGHGIGLAHPHDGGSRPDATLFPGVTSSSSTGQNGLNQGIWTVMSYIDGWPAQFPASSQEITYGKAATLMALDIAALQVLYGANTTFRTGDDTYVLPEANAAGTGWVSIWDAGGTDTISAAGASTGVTIDLRAAPLTGPNAGGYVSWMNGIAGGYTIANGVLIERAVGGSGNDTITGNSAANVLRGGGGNDVIQGGGGRDVISGGAGGDQLDGGGGVDAARVQGTAAGNPAARTSADSLTVGGDAITGFEVLIYDDTIVYMNLPDQLATFTAGGRGAFDEAFYLAQNDDVAAAVRGGMFRSGLQHFQAFGVREGRDPNALFDTAGYLDRWDDVDAAVERGAFRGAYEHYVEFGWREGRDPSALFGVSDYLGRNADVRDARVDPLQHWLVFGVDEGRAARPSDLSLMLA